MNDFSDNYREFSTTSLVPKRDKVKHWGFRVESENYSQYGTYLTTTGCKMAVFEFQRTKWIAHNARKGITIG